MLFCSELTSNFLKPQIEQFESQQLQQKPKESKSAQESTALKQEEKEEGARAKDTTATVTPPQGAEKKSFLESELARNCIAMYAGNRKIIIIAIVLGVMGMILMDMKLPPILLCGLVLLMQILDDNTADKGGVDAAQTKSSSTVLSESSTTSVLACRKTVCASSVAVKPTANFSGMWKRTKVVNFEAFLTAQGVAYVQRKLAMSMTMIHTITMDDELTVFRLQEKGGPLVTDSAFVIGGDSCETELGPKKWLDTVTWEGADCLHMVKVLLPDKDIEVVVRRRLENGGKCIRQDSIMTTKSTGKTLETTSFFEYEGPSPNEKPATVRLAVEGEDLRAESTTEASVQLSMPDRRDLSGVWTRERTHNVDSYVGKLLQFCCCFIFILYL